jgi:hypothetical protein
MTEITMETEVILGREFDGSNWYLTICGHKLGPPRTKTECEDVLKWFDEGGLQGVIDVFEVILDKAFKEEGNGK